MRLLMAGVTAPSHIYPSLAVIRELVARGHDVSYAVGDRLAGLVTPTGAGHIGYRSELPDSDTAWSGDPGEAMQLFLDDEQTALPAILAADRPDAVLYDIGGYAGRVAAHHWGVPAIQLSPTYVAWDGYEEDMAEFTAGLKASPSGARFFAGVRSWLDENGMASMPTRSSAAPRPASRSSPACCSQTPTGSARSTSSRGRALTRPG
jgi:MGT family glycosyltransferase